VSPRSGPHPALVPLTTLAAGAAATAYLYRTDPHQSGHLLPRCPFNWATGLLCPFCGATRMVYDLTHRHYATAWHDNALLLLVSPLLLALLGRWVAEGLRGNRWRPATDRRRVAVVVTVALAWMVVRNVW
jgi:Protein of unknown function (DUF2752)